ncbi:hypothetical protein KGF54_001452 [Candida jiufengensis]|uniref:uncharacterized protein n=1 Tax=Candida jiufengensis TaxID=497108 RepID=UPI0022251C72|nr:uncharacterized protein KGF54_001452 [Candida jiufengensis]KAI5954891.1 hypothetical protein KGF54_001452 [Candida jiufengensis]
MKSFSSSSATTSTTSQSQSSPSRKNWRTILKSNKQKGGNTSSTSDYDYSSASSKLFPTLSIQESSHSPISNISTPTFDHVNYKTPTTSPIRLNPSPRNKFIPTKDPFNFEDHQEQPILHMEGLNISFANILNNNSPQIKQQETKIDSPKSIRSNKSFASKILPMENNCFICSELLSNVFQSERILKLNCGDSVHYECFKVMFSKELEDIDKNKTITFPNLCHGYICQGENPIEIDYKRLNISPRRTSLTPKRPAPAQPNRNSEVKQSINFEALKSTLNDVQRKPSRRESKKELRRDSSRRFSSKRDTIHSSIRSVSPVTTISTTMTETYNLNDFSDGEIEIVINQLIKFLLDHCPNFNLSKLSLLGKLRVADQLQVNINNQFTIKYCYLFENYLIIWNNDIDPIYFTMKDTKVICKGSIISIYGVNDLTISIKSELSSIIEKWAILLMDSNLELPGTKLTNTILLKPKLPLPISERNSIRESFFINRPKSLNLKLLETVESISPTDKSNKSINNLSNDISMDISNDITNDDSDIDSDIDSDDELIKNVLNDKKIDNKPIIDLKDLQNLISEIDQAML